MYAALSSRNLLSRLRISKTTCIFYNENSPSKISSIPAVSTISSLDPDAIFHHICFDPTTDSSVVKVEVKMISLALAENERGDFFSSWDWGESTSSKLNNLSTSCSRKFRRCRYACTMHIHALKRKEKQVLRAVLSLLSLAADGHQVTGMWFTIFVSVCEFGSENFARGPGVCQCPLFA